MRNNINSRSAPLAAGRRWALLLILGLAVNTASVAWGAEAPVGKATNPQAPSAPKGRFEEKYGIRTFGPYLSGGGNLIDFRYKVLDAAKAAPLTERENKPSLINPANGAKLLIPDTPKLGQLRQITTHPVEGKVYFMLFANTRHHVKHGDKVTITAGECKLEDLIVE